MVTYQNWDWQGRLSHISQLWWRQDKWLDCSTSAWPGTSSSSPGVGAGAGGPRCSPGRSWSRSDWVMTRHPLPLLAVCHRLDSQSSGAARKRGSKKVWGFACELLLLLLLLLLEYTFYNQNLQYAAKWFRLSTIPVMLTFNDLQIWLQGP